MRPAHCMVQVRDLEAAIAFYAKALGFRVADRHRYDGATLVYMRGKDHGFELELLAPDEWPFAERPEAGRTHIAFTVDDLDAEHARLVSLGIRVDPVADYVANGVLQTRFFYVHDPEGNQVEFLEPRGRYAGPGGRDHVEPDA